LTIALRTTRLTLLAAVVASIAACREGVAPFSPPQIDRGPESPRQITFSAFPDVNPSWSAGSDTVYYSTPNAYDFPQAPRSLLRIARGGGLADLLAPTIDPRSANALVLPVMSPTHDRIAYVRLGYMLPPAVCGPPGPLPAADCLGTEPLLDTAYLRVRPVSAINESELDVTTPIPFQGVDPARARGGATSYLQHAYPYQVAFTKSNDLVFRPSWAPDGSRLVFSDGLMLRTWNGTTPTSDVVPNTSDGVSPAWSPTANRIAFTRMIRGDSVLVRCVCWDPPVPPGRDDPFPVHNRWFYELERNVVTLVDPDGSNAVELVDGNEPAWSPDGSTIYFTKDANIYRVPASGGTPVKIEGTQFGRAPAVSPDGKWLAFAKYSADDRNADIWVIRLVQE
jgi:hypothetical protein